MDILVLLNNLVCFSLRHPLRFAALFDLLRNDFRVKEMQEECKGASVLLLLRRVILVVYKMDDDEI